MITYSPYYLIELRKRLGGKLKSLLGKQNIETTLQDAYNNFYCFPTNEGGFSTDGSGGKKAVLKENHKYAHIICFTKDITELFVFSRLQSRYDSTYPSIESNYASGGVGINVFNQTENIEACLGFRSNFYFGNTFTVRYNIILDLTKAKLADFEAEDIFNILTLNGTDFSDLELLAAGYTIKLNEFKKPTTNTLDLGDVTYGYGGDSGDMVRVIYTGCPDRIPMSSATISQTDKLQYIDYGMGTGEEFINKISTTTYSHYVYIGLSKTALGWQVGDGDDLLNTKAKEYLKGIKLTYELANTDVLGKYGAYTFSKNDNWFYLSSYNVFYCQLPDNVKLNGTNIFIEGYTAKDVYCNGLEDKEITGFGGGGNYIWIKSLEWETNTQKAADSMADKTIIYELQNPVDDKFDEYTAEQFYNMFAATLFKKPLTLTGRKLLCVDGIILGTKYGIIDLGDLTWYYESSWWGYNNPRFFAYLPHDIVLVDSLYKANMYIDGYETRPVSGTYSDTSLDMVVCSNVSNYFNVIDKRYDNATNFKNSLKGKYLIYELAEPNGTAYDDLTAEDIYNMLNDNQIEIFANGKSVNGVRSLTGYWNNPNAVDSSPYNTFSGFYITKSGCSTGYSNMELLDINVIKDHTYLMYVEFKNDLSETRKNENYNALFITNENYEHICSEQWYMYQNKNFIVEIATGLVNGKGVALSYYSNGPQVNKNEMIPTKAIVVDLTENNINFVANHDKYEKMKAYNYFVENNLKTLVDSGELRIGGYIKPEQPQTTIEFYVKDDTFTALENMTWTEFVNSAYNEGRFSIVDGFVVIDANDKVLDTNYEAVSPDDIIQNGYTYYK